MLVQWDEEDEREIHTVDELDALLDDLDAVSRDHVLPYVVILWTGHPADDDRPDVREGPHVGLVSGCGGGELMRRFKELHGERLHAAVHPSPTPKRERGPVLLAFGRGG